jgi:hypothetical protein
METEKVQKVPTKFSCEICDYFTSRHSQYERHLNTSKHQKLSSVNKMEQKSSNEYLCSKCNKSYKDRTGLWKHNKVCNEIPIDEKTPSSESEVKILTNIVLEIVKSNSELQKQMLDVCQKFQPSSTINNNTTNNNNSHNKTFNLNFFLNEQCKDAMNIMDFVNTFQLEFADFERIGEVGYVEGISNIVINKLNEMDVYKRPIHCSDAKREIMYVKDKDVWAKENASNDKIRLALKHITKKNSDMIRPWANAHPGVLSGDHRLSDKYQIMIIEAMGGNKNKTMREGEDKIIKKISKMVLIDKGGYPSSYASP